MDLTTAPPPEADGTYPTVTSVRSGPVYIEVWRVLGGSWRLVGSDGTDYGFVADYEDAIDAATEAVALLEDAYDLDVNAATKRAEALAAIPPLVMS